MQKKNISRRLKNWKRFLGSVSKPNKPAKHLSSIRELEIIELRRDAEAGKSLTFEEKLLIDAVDWDVVDCKAVNCDFQKLLSA